MNPGRLLLAYGLDLLLGDPAWFPHPVRIFGTLIKHGERFLRKFAGTPARDLSAGAVLTVAVTGAGWLAGRPTNAGWQVLLAWTALATRSLIAEANAVIRALEANDLILARQRLARIVGRDTAHLDATEISRAVIETVAESACDGILAPLFWLAAGGVPMAMAYKAVNTLDSMIGHREAPYTYFGRVPARLDDVANFIPARLTALAIAAAAGVHRGDAQGALAVWKRDGDRHASPNAGQSEAAMAGALNVRLGGLNHYDGQPKAAPLLNPEGRLASVHDAKSAVKIVATASALALGAALFVNWKRGRRR